mmetsp:Transcript_47237/g.122074  ORF Transcript_47237/g.122074 Transcript_47237/m.122074 type:complete len:711 (+) Transcript_47237:1148-3280(+)
MLLEDVLVEDRDEVPEHDGVGDLHHRGLEVHGEEHILLLRVLDLLLDELTQSLGAHERGVDDLAGQQRRLGLQHDGRAVLSDMLDAHIAGRVGDPGLLAGVEVALAHVRNVRLRRRAPLAHGVRVLLGVVLHRHRGAAVGVALAQHRVHRAAEDGAVPLLDLLVLRGLRVLGVVRHVVALRLQLRDARLELRHGGRDVGQLHDVGQWRLRQGAQLCKAVALLLVVRELLGEAPDHAPSHGDVLQLDLDAGLLREGLDDGEEGVGREHGRLVGEGIHDLRAPCLHVPQRLGDLVDELLRVQELLRLRGLGVDARLHEILRHVAPVHCLLGGGLEHAREALELRVVVELGAVLQALGPGVDAADGVDGRLGLAEHLVAGAGRRQRLGGEHLAVGAQQHGAHQLLGAEALRDHLGLHVAVVVLAGPDEAAGGAHGEGHHRVNGLVLVPDAGLLERLLVGLLVGLLEDAYEGAVVVLQQQILGAEVQRHLHLEGVLEARVREALDLVDAVVHGHGDTATGPEVVHVVGLGIAARGGRHDDLILGVPADWDVGAAVLVGEDVARDDDGLGPLRDELREGRELDGRTEVGTVEAATQRGRGRAERALPIEDGGALPHLHEALLLDHLVGQLGGGALDTDPAVLDGSGCINRYLVQGCDPVVQRKVEVLDRNIDIRHDQLLLDAPPDATRHLITIDLHDRVAHLDLGSHRRSACKQL